MSALKSDLASSGKKICECDSKVLLAFDAEDVRNTTIRGGVIVFRCSGFKVDKEESTGKWNEAFGPVDPDELENNVRKEIDKIRHPNTAAPDVEIRDRDTLVQDLGDNIDGA